jgi:hypothetical protein
MAKKTTVAPGRNGGDETSNARNWQSAKKRAGVDAGESKDVRGGLTHRTTTDPYRAEAREAETSMASGLTLGEIPNYDGAERTITGTSIFDPVLCEIAYRWFSPPGGLVLDPFAGGSVRGIVAAALGRQYLGIDLRPEQVEANQHQAEKICVGAPFAPRWLIGDSLQVLDEVQPESADMVFSCPPYGDLEVYSDLAEDLSTMEFAAFLSAYASIIRKAVACLKPDRFAAFVVGDYRGPDGFYRNFPGRTIDAFEAAGARLYNYGILVTAAGSLPIRAGKQFSTTRKLGKTHQDILVFCKGDPRKATEAIGEVEFGDVGADDSAEAEDSAQGAPSGAGGPSGDSQWGEKL